MNYEEIGKLVKLQSDGHYDEFSDEEVGKLYAKKHLQDALTDQPQLFLKSRTEHVAKQTDLTIARAGQPMKVAQAVLGSLHETAVLPKRLDQQDQIADAGAHENLRLIQGRTKVASDAAARSMDLPTHMAVRQVEESARVEVEKTARLNTLMESHQRELKAIEIQYRGEQIGQDIQAAMSVQLNEKYKLLHIQDQVLALIERAHQIQTSTKPQAVKDAQLEVIGEVIQGFRGELRGLLQGDNRQRLQGSDSPADS